MLVGRGHSGEPCQNLLIFVLDLGQFAFASAQLAHEKGFFAVWGGAGLERCMVFHFDLLDVIEEDLVVLFDGRHPLFVHLDCFCVVYCAIYCFTVNHHLELRIPTLSGLCHSLLVFAVVQFPSLFIDKEVATAWKFSIHLNLDQQKFKN